jgi:hypothetical protein
LFAPLICNAIHKLGAPLFEEPKWPSEYRFEKCECVILCLGYQLTPGLARQLTGRFSWPTHFATPAAAASKASTSLNL